MTYKKNTKSGLKNSLTQENVVNKRFVTYKKFIRNDDVFISPDGYMGMISRPLLSISYLFMTICYLNKLGSIYAE